MPSKIPQRQVPEKPSIGKGSVPMPKSQSFGTRRALSQSVIDTSGGHAGDRMIERAMSNVVSGVQAYAKSKVIELEGLRRVKVLESTPEVLAGINAEWRAAQERTGSNAKGVTDDFLKKRDELMKEAIPDGAWDRESEIELKQAFMSGVGQIANKMMNWEVQQAEAAKKTVSRNKLSEIVSEVLKYQPPQDPAVAFIGLTNNVDMLVSDFVATQEYMYPEGLPEETKVAIERSTKQHLLQAYLSEWVAKGPAQAREVWKTNEDFFKDAMPDSYVAMNNTMKAAKKDADYDTAMALLRVQHAQPDGTVSTYGMLMESRTEAFRKSHMKDPSEADRLTASLEQSYIRQTSIQDELKKKSRENLVSAIATECRDSETGAFDTEQALYLLEQSRRKGDIVDEEYYNKMKREWSVNTPLTASERLGFLNRIEQAITNDKPMTSAEINAMVGPRANPSEFQSYAKSVESAKRARMGIGSFLEDGMSVWKEYCNKQKSPSAKRREAGRTSDFERELRAWMISKKLTVYDAEVLERAKLMTTEFAKDLDENPVYSTGSDISKWGNDAEGIFMDFSAEDQKNIEKAMELRKTQGAKILPMPQHLKDAGVTYEDFEELGYPCTALGIKKMEEDLADKKKLEELSRKQLEYIGAE